MVLFKPLLFVAIGIAIKLVVDLFRYHVLKVDYELVYLVLIGMIIPYNTNIIMYGIVLLIMYIISIFVKDKIKCNKVCFW